MRGREEAGLRPVANFRSPDSVAGIKRGSSLPSRIDFLLTDVIKTTIPAGILKVTIEGAVPTSACFLQFSGDSATSLHAAHDLVPAAPSRTATVR